MEYFARAIEKEDFDLLLHYVSKCLIDVVAIFFMSYLHDILRQFGGTQMNFVDSRGSVNCKHTEFFFISQMS